MASISRARQLRRNATDAEAALWHDLRTLSIKFRRQQPIGPYIVDFICFSHKLIIECDGDQHAENIADRRRDEWFSDQGFGTLRFWNHEVLRNRDGVIRVILDALCAAPPHPDPLPRGERE